MANYIGLQGVFNALAGGGANAVNIYAQEKDRQRRLAFDEKKFDADQAYKQKVLAQNDRQMTQADRKLDLTEEAYRSEEEATRRKELIKRQTAVSGNAGTLAGQRGFNDRVSFLASDDPDGHMMLEASMSNLASHERRAETQVKLVPVGQNEQGEKLYQTTFLGKKGKQQNFGPAATKMQLAGQVKAMNVSYGITDHLAAAGVGVQVSPDGKKILVNQGDGGPELKPEQQQLVSELEGVAQQATGAGLQDLIDNPPEQAVQVALGEVDKEPGEGLAYDGMPSGERYRKPRNLKEFYEEESRTANAMVGENPHIKAYDNAGGGVSGAAALVGSAVGARVKKYADAYGAVKDGLTWAGEQVMDKAGTAIDAGKASFKGEVLAPEAEPAEQQTSQKKSTTPPAEKPPAKSDERAEKATEQVANPKTSPRRRAAIFASQIQASGGDMSDANTQKMYQGLLNPETSSGLSAEAARTLSELRAQRGEQRAIAKERATKNRDTVDNFSKRFSDIDLQRMGYTNHEDVAYNVTDSVAKNKALLAAAGLPGDIDKMNDTQLARLLGMVEKSMRGNNKDKGFWSDGKTNTRGSISNNIIPTEIAAESFFQSRTPEARNAMIEEAGSEDAALRQLIEDFKKARQADE